MPSCNVERRIFRPGVHDNSVAVVRRMVATQGSVVSAGDTRCNAIFSMLSVAGRRPTAELGSYSNRTEQETRGTTR